MDYASVPVSSFLPCASALVFPFCNLAPETKPFLMQLYLVIMFITATEKQKRTSMNGSKVAHNSSGKNDKH